VTKNAQIYVIERPLMFADLRCAGAAVTASPDEGYEGAVRDAEDTTVLDLARGAAYSPRPTDRPFTR